MVKQTFKKELGINHIRLYGKGILNNMVKYIYNIYMYLIDKGEVQKRKWTVKKKVKIKETEENLK